MPDKEFKTLDQQIDILQQRGLAIDDIGKAKEFLLRNNYYRISGYSLTLRNHDIFYPGTSFQNIIDIYSFDHELRHLLLHYLETIEVAVKSIYAYEFTRIHGATGYLDAANFIDANEHSQIIHNGNAQMNKRHAYEAYIKHFLDTLHQNLPLWAYVDLLTIADISKLYKISEPSLKSVIAAHFGLDTSRGSDILENFLRCMTILRNTCAHGSRLFNRLFQQKPKLSKAEKKLLIEDKNGNIDNSHLYSFILIMRQLLREDEFTGLKNGIIALTQKYPFVSMSYYGFREDWKSKL